MTTKAIYCYSLTGKTEASLDLVKSVKITKLNNENGKAFKFGDEEIIFIGSPTYGRGVPPSFFKEILSELKNLSGRKIGLFGSGNTIYGNDYCGALDVLEEILGAKNEVVFKYKFEGYPTEKDKKEISKLIMDVIL